MEVKDCRAIITGGASGLGEATVRKIAGCGGKVLIADLAEDRASHLIKELGEMFFFENGCNKRRRHAESSGIRF